MIKIEINNGRIMEVGQTEELIKIVTREGDNVDRVDGISEGDFVMLMNYYRYVKDNNIQCDFINPNGQQAIK